MQFTDSHIHLQDYKEKNVQEIIKDMKNLGFSKVICVSSKPCDWNEVAKIAIDAGARGIWNFAHTDISVPEDVVVENVHLSESIMRLSYKLKEKK